MPRRTKDEAEITRQALLDAALVVFSANGYNATRLEDVAAEAGVTRGAIYHHFGSKVELYNQLIDTVLSEVSPLIVRALNSGSGALDTLRQVFAAPLLYATSNPRYRAVCELIYLKTEALPELAEGRREKTEANKVFLQQIASVVAKGQAAGEIDSGVNPRDAAALLVSLQGGLLALWMMDAAFIDLDTRVGAVADIFLRGLTVRPS